MKIAVVFFSKTNNETATHLYHLVEEWEIKEKDWEKIIGTADLTQKILNEYAESYIRLYGYKRGIDHYRAWIEEVEN